ncbi:MAG TPA: NHL repeat-containing protein [Solirubrobacterales bacterium]|nr:NHL repeat-containing protein [Solirubrobacterales bacterium]
MPLPPAGELERPCGLAVDTSGNFYVADNGHDVVDGFSSSFGYFGQVTGAAPATGPCGLAVDDEIGHYVVNEMHGAVIEYSSLTGAGKTVLDPGPATGVAIDPTTGDTYVDDIDHVSVYGPSGAPVEVGGQPLVIGAGSLVSGYGIAISHDIATSGFVYVPDAATNTVKVYDPATDVEEPVESLTTDFTSLRDSAVAVDDASGDVYVADDLQPGTSECPEAAIQVFGADGDYGGRLKYNIVDAQPPGLAVDNSGTSSQGRVYVTTGNSERASVMLYQPGSAGSEAAAALPCPSPLPPGQGSEAPLPEPPAPVTCVGDSCQNLPSEPRDPTLSTLLVAPGNGPVKFFDTNQVSHVRNLRGHHHRRAHKAKKAHPKKPAKAHLNDRARPATASASSIVRKGNLQVKVSGSLAPKRLPRESLAPVSVSIAGQITTTDKSTPPELNELEVDLNNHGRLETTGLPICRAGEIHPASTSRALAACGASLVGSGSFSVDVVLAGQEPYPTSGRLLLFNGVYEHKHALLGQIYSAHPFANSFVIPFLIHEGGKGTYGLSLSAKLPRALTSWGRVTGLELKLQRNYSYAGKRRSFISASCPAPKGFPETLFTLARASFSFAGSRTLTQTVSDQCRPRS